MVKKPFTPSSSSCKKQVKSLTAEEAVDEILNANDENDDFEEFFDDDSSTDEEEFVENDEDLSDSEIPIIAAPLYQESLLMNDIRCLIFICDFIFCDLPLIWI